MSGSTLKCPNCGHPRSGGNSCPNCGIIFAKYAAKQRRLEELELQKQLEREQKRAGALKIAGIAVVAVMASALGYMMLGGEESTGAVAKSDSGAARDFSNPYNPYNPHQTQQLIADDVKKAMKAVTFTVRNPKLSYPHNSGSALLITSSCQAITDWNISVERNSNSSSQEARVESYNEQIAHYESIIEEKRQAFLSTCSDCSTEAFERTVSRERKRLDSAIEGYNDAMSRYVDSVSTAFKISATLNKNQYQARVDERNPTIGLSLIYVEDAVQCEPAKIGDTDKLKVGDRVFMMGGNGRISDGVITRFSTTSGGLQLINHTASGSKTGGSGLSGVPLFNEQGEVLGIHIRSSGSERNAITIGDVLKDFRIPL